MKSYIGVRIVEAEPQDKQGVPGYKVKYPSGKETWCEKKAFEEAFREIGKESSVERQ